MYRCPSCGYKISKKYLVVEKSEYKPHWYEIYYNSALKYSCAHCGTQLEFEGQELLVIAVFFEVLFASAIIYFFDVPRLLMAIIVVGIFFLLLKTIIKVRGQSKGAN